MKRILTVLLISTILSLSINGCVTSSKKETKDEILPERSIEYLMNQECWCVPDEYMKILFKEAIRE